MFAQLHNFVGMQNQEQNLHDTWLCNTNIMQNILLPYNDYIYYPYITHIIIT